MYPKQRIIVRPITSNPVLRKKSKFNESKKSKSGYQQIITIRRNITNQLQVEKTKLEMQFLVDIERKKTETNKQIIQQAFLETKEILNEVTHKKLNFIQKQNEETTNQLIILHQEEIQKLHQQYGKQIETFKQQWKLKEEELQYNYELQLNELKIQIKKNFDYQLEQYRQQFLKERAEINERHSWDIKRIKEKNDDQLKVIFDRLSKEYETKLNQQNFELTSSYESKIDQQKQQIIHLQDQINYISNQHQENEIQLQKSVNIDEKTYSNIQTQTLINQTFKETEIQTDVIIQEIQPLYCTNYEEIIQQNNQLKQNIYDNQQELQKVNIELIKQKNEIQFLLQLVMKYQNIFT